MEMLECGVEAKALIHITGDGFRNLRRIKSEAGFVLDDLPKPPAIFELIQKIGNVSNAEMANTFNMGIGFCIVLPDDEKQIERCISIAEGHGVGAKVIGFATSDKQRTISIPQWGIKGNAENFFEE